MTDAERAELKRLAEGATKGPWAKFPEDRTWHDGTTVIDDPDVEAVAYARSVADARYIAAANPAAVLDLLSENDRLRTALAEVRDSATMSYAKRVAGEALEEAK